MTTSPAVSSSSVVGTILPSTLPSCWKIRNALKGMGERAALLHAKREQDVTRDAAERSVPGIGQHETTGNYRARAVDRSALGRYSVHGPEILQRVELPDDAAIRGRIRAEIAVHGPGEHGPRDHRDRCRLRRIASPGRGTGDRRRWRAPDLLAGRQTKRPQPALFSRWPQD